MSRVARPRRPRWSRALLLTVAMVGCRCSRLGDEVDGQTFTRCSAVDPPESRTVRAGSLTLRVDERTLEVVLAPPAALRVAAFTGPVGGRLRESDLASLTAATPGLLLYLGGLGDDTETALDNLRALARLGVPTVFVPGGADRLPVITAAFEALDAKERDLMFSAAGLHVLRVGGDKFVLVPGAPLGAYAIDGDGCGLATRDLEAIRATAASGPSAARTWLVSWQAPAGLGVSEALDGSELGSPDLKALASAIGARGGLFAYPEVQTMRPGTGPLAHVVPRLGASGSVRADGSRVESSVLRLVLGVDGPSVLP